MSLKVDDFFSCLVESVFFLLLGNILLSICVYFIKFPVYFITEQKFTSFFLFFTVFKFIFYLFFV